MLCRILQSIFEEMHPISERTLVLLVANPVDILATIAQRVSGLPARRVLGSGTLLDSMRLRGAVGQELGLDSNSVHLYVVGEHGDSQVAMWSSGAPACMHVAQAHLGAQGESTCVQGMRVACRCRSSRS
jgi:malate/lactate dehydrogenase